MKAMIQDFIAEKILGTLVWIVVGLGGMVLGLGFILMLAFGLTILLILAFLFGVGILIKPALLPIIQRSWQDS